MSDKVSRWIKEFRKVVTLKQTKKDVLVFVALQFITKGAVWIIYYSNFGKKSLVDIRLCRSLN